MNLATFNKDFLLVFDIKASNLFNIGQRQSKVLGIVSVILCIMGKLIKMVFVFY